MSWSITCAGFPSAVLKRVKTQLASLKCAEPEETIKSKVAEIIEVCLLAFPEGAAVSVDASGSQHTPDYQKPKEVTNTLSVSVKPLYGFVKD